MPQGDNGHRVHVVGLVLPGPVMAEADLMLVGKPLFIVLAYEAVHDATPEPCPGDGPVPFGVRAGECRMHPGTDLSEPMINQLLEPGPDKSPGSVQQLLVPLGEAEQPLQVFEVVPRYRRVRDGPIVVSGWVGRIHASSLCRAPIAAVHTRSLVLRYAGLHAAT